MHFEIPPAFAIDYHDLYPNHSIKKTTGLGMQLHGSAHA
jgi:hypothetical protein